MTNPTYGGAYAYGKSEHGTRYEAGRARTNARRKPRDQRPDTSTLSRHDYTYDTVGSILTWQQQADSASPERWRYT